MGDSSVGMPQHAILNAWGSLVRRPRRAPVPRRLRHQNDTMAGRRRAGDARPEALASTHAGRPWERAAGGFVYPQWSALCMAFSAWGQAYTGLPIDFQLQSVEWANRTYDGTREPLGVRITA